VRTAPQIAAAIRGLTPLAPAWTLKAHSAGASGRSAVETFLEAAYHRAFRGAIQSHYPTLLSLHDHRGEIQAAVGFRLASEGPLFLEQYLDATIEHLLPPLTGEALTRVQIAEIGTLASNNAGASLRLFQALARRLEAEGCTHAVATATRQLRRLFKRIGFSTEILSAADPARLGPAATQWGGYYDREPEVRAGAIAAALALLDRLLADHAPLAGGAQ
jgi:hypothetical protein